jgi:hypothetical protein
MSENTIATVRTFESGATRNLDTSKLDFSGFFNPIVLERYAEYMHKNRFLEDGSMRASDNWQKGIPRSSCIQSAWRHFHDWWLADRGYQSRDTIEEAICGLMFNAQAYLLALLRDRNYKAKTGEKAA